MATFQKYTDIEYMGHSSNISILDYPEDIIEVSEKVDGANGAFFRADDVIHVCTRATDLTEEKDRTRFIESQKWIEENLYNKLDLIDNTYVYYIEHVETQHTLDYGKLDFPFVGLDIRPCQGAFGKTPAFIGYKAKTEIFKKLGIEPVHTIWIGKAKELSKMNVEEMFLKSKSHYFDSYPEGVVLKNFDRVNYEGNQMFAKIVRPEFKEMNKATFGGLKLDKNETIDLVDVYANEARIKKQILKLTVDGGKKLNRELMQWLPDMVMKDIFKEEYEEISKKKVLDVGLMKQKIAKKCIEVLDRVERENKRRNEV